MRVLAHFYTFEHFMDPELDKAVKRFVRNYIHYRDEVRGLCMPLSSLLGRRVHTPHTTRPNPLHPLIH